MSDGIPDDRWELAEVIYLESKRSAWGNSRSFSVPERRGYTHNPVAAFDIALDCAKALLAQYEIRRRGPDYD
jgi:hypothetical protein